MAGPRSHGRQRHDLFSAAPCRTARAPQGVCFSKTTEGVTQSKGRADVSRTLSLLLDFGPTFCVSAPCLSRHLSLKDDRRSYSTNTQT